MQDAVIVIAKNYLVYASKTKKDEKTLFSFNMPTSAMKCQILPLNKQDLISIDYFNDETTVKPITQLEASLTRKTHHHAGVNIVSGPLRKMYHEVELDNPMEPSNLLTTILGEPQGSYCAYIKPMCMFPSLQKSSIWSVAKPEWTGVLITFLNSVGDQMSFGDSENDNEILIPLVHNMKNAMGGYHYKQLVIFDRSVHQDRGYKSDTKLIETTNQEYLRPQRSSHRFFKFPKKRTISDCPQDCYAGTLPTFPIAHVFCNSPRFLRLDTVSTSNTNNVLVKNLFDVQTNVLGCPH